MKVDRKAGWMYVNDPVPFFDSGATALTTTSSTEVNLHTSTLNQNNPCGIEVRGSSNSTSNTATFWARLNSTSGTILCTGSTTSTSTTGVCAYVGYRNSGDVIYIDASISGGGTATCGSNGNLGRTFVMQARIVVLDTRVNFYYWAHDNLLHVLNTWRPHTLYGVAESTGSTFQIVSSGSDTGTNTANFGNGTGTLSGLKGDVISGLGTPGTTGCAVGFSLVGAIIAAL